jgi:hypothetical protein
MRAIGVMAAVLLACCGGRHGGRDAGDEIPDVGGEELVEDVTPETTGDPDLDGGEVLDAGGDPGEDAGDAEPDAWEYERGSLGSCLLDPSCERVGITSHMGAWTATVPGNSMAAYRRAYDLGADAIEADVRVSRDGVPFMIHDDEITMYQSVMCAGRVISESDAADIDGCLLVPSLTETIPSFDEFVTWARGKILIHLDIKQSEHIEVMVEQITAYGAQDFVFIAASVGEATTVVPGVASADRVYFLLRVGSVADVDEALGSLRAPNFFMLEGDRSWDDPPVSEIEMLAQIARVHADGLRIMASSDIYSATVADHQHLFDMGFDYVLSYNTANGVEAARSENVSRGYPP